jgi:arginyl-tRNA synthetase
MEKYAGLIADVVGELFSIDIEIQLSRPEPKFGDFATNIALQISKQVGDNPRVIAEKITEELRENPVFESVDIAGPGFLNLKISAQNLAQELDNGFSGDKPFGENSDGEGKTAVVEYPSPNVAKPYSVGHLRSGNQGWAAKNLLEASGWHVITDNHLGDSGSPFGYWVLGFEKYSSDEQLEQSGVYELGRVYIAIRETLKEEESRGEHVLADQAQEWLIKLENKDPEAVAYSEKFNRISLDHIHTIMARLGISTDHEYGESFFVEQGKAAVAKLLDEKIATKNSDGSVIVDLEKQGIKTPLLILKSNGAALYATTDLATILWRKENWHPDKVVYCVGAEQKFYFEQLAALAKKMGIKTELYHLWFGTIDQMTDGKRAKMSSRKGVILMEELLDAALEKAKQNAKSADMIDDDLRKISVGAIKFNDFAADRRTGMLFDWDKMFSLTGFSGPYVQYAAVRVNKILQDNQVENNRTLETDYDFANEKNLILKLLEYPNTVRDAAEALEPHRIATYVYELARELNKYYETTPVATKEVPEEIKHIRLELLAKISQIFTHGLGILGIEIPEKM